MSDDVPAEIKELRELKARLAELEQRVREASVTKPSDPTALDTAYAEVVRANHPPPRPSLEQAVGDRLAERDAADRQRRLEQLADGWKRDEQHERAIALRDSGPEGRAMVADAYRGAEWELAWYEDGKRAAAEREKESSSG